MKNDAGAGMRDGIRDILRDILDDENVEVTDTLSPENTPAWDSFAQVKIIIAIEEEFGVNFTMDEVAEVHNAGDLLRMVSSKQPVN